MGLLNTAYSHTKVLDVTNQACVNSALSSWPFKVPNHRPIIKTLYNKDKHARRLGTNDLSDNIYGAILGKLPNVPWEY